VAFRWLKKNRLWIIKAVDRCRRRTVAWVVGNRDTATFKRLYEKVKHLKDCIFYTDGWDAFAAVLPQERHIVGKATLIRLKVTTAILAITLVGLHVGPKLYLVATIWFTLP